MGEEFLCIPRSHSVGYWMPHSQHNHKILLFPDWTAIAPRCKSAFQPLRPTDYYTRRCILPTNRLSSRTQEGTWLLSWCPRAMRREIHFAEFKFFVLHTKLFAFRRVEVYHTESISSMYRSSWTTLNPCTVVPNTWPS